MKKIVFLFALVLSVLQVPAPNPNYRRLINKPVSAETKLYVSYVKLAGGNFSRTALYKIDFCIRQVYNSGAWTDLDRFYLFANYSSIAARVSIVNPQSTVASEVNSPQFTPFTGYRFNGVSNYVNLNYIPNTHGVKYTLNSASWGYYYYHKNTLLNGANGCFSTGTDANDFPPDGVNIACAINCLSCGTQRNTAPGSSASLNYKRTGAATTDYYQNGVSSLGNNGSSVSRPTVRFYVGCRNGNGTPGNFNDAGYSVFYIGGTAYNQAQMYSAIVAIKAKLGFQ